MAQEGDTITYSYSDGTSVAEDVSSVDEITVDYMDGAGGSSGGSTGGNGGRVENATIDVSNEDTIYIWVANSTDSGRYSSNDAGGAAGASTEISFSNTSQSDSSDEPFLVGAGGGGGDYEGVLGGNGGSRGGNAGAGFFGNAGDGGGVAPPLGGDGGKANDSISPTDGDGAIDDQNRGVVSGGTTIKGGGSPADTEGEIQLSFQSVLSPPDPPSNLTAEVQ